MMHISDPVIVATSKPFETRWGYFQFPSICRLPGGELMVTINNTEDATSGYGDPLLRFISTDSGATWTPAERFPQASIPPAFCSPVFNGEYLVTPGTNAFDVEGQGIAMPPPVGTTFAHQEFRYYRTSDCHPALQEYLKHMPAQRWMPAQPAWVEEIIQYDVPDSLCWTFGKETAVSRPWFEHTPIRHQDELLYMDYRAACLVDGKSPQGFTCLLMVSKDNGHSFHKRALAVAGRVYEPILADTAAGELVCVMRGADQEQRPMLITYSPDHGCHWGPTQELFPFGVFPSLVRMSSGALLLAFGRPGVWVSASMDGTGRNWSEPAQVLAGDPDKLGELTCGYTGLLPTGPDEALLVYSNFQHHNAAGQQCKSVEVRRINLAG
jgi:hypothetical protein